MSLPLPLELCEAIIDHLKSDKLSLYACSLTCKAWLPRSRHRLFYSISLFPSNNKQFLAVLSSSPTNPGTYVHSLRINEGRGRYRTEPRWVNAALPRLATHLLGVTELCIDLVEWHLLDKAARAGIISGFQSVQTLALSNLTFNSCTQLVELVASFPALKSFSCEAIGGVEHGAPEAWSLIRPPRDLHSLYLGSFPKSHFVDWLLGQEAVPDIHTLVLAHSLSQVQNVGKLLKGLGPRLEHLTIGLTAHFETSQAAAALREHIDLAHNTHLRSIHLNDMTLERQYSFDDSLLDWIPMVLAQLDWSQIEDVLFSFWPNDIEELDVLNWALVDRIIGEQRACVASALRRVTIVLAGQVDSQEAAEEIRERLPVLEANGILCFA